MDVWTNSIMTRSLAIFLVGTFTRLMGPMRVRPLAVAQKITHTTFSTSNLGVSSAVVNLSFSSINKRAGECFTASASAKQKPVQCTTVIASKLNHKDADMNCHAARTKLEATPCVKNCVSLILEHSPPQRLEQHQVQAAVSHERSVKRW